jgi:hypothetical protein
MGLVVLSLAGELCLSAAPKGCLTVPWQRDSCEAMRMWDGHNTTFFLITLPFNLRPPPLLGLETVLADSANLPRIQVHHPDRLRLVRVSIVSQRALAPSHDHLTSNTSTIHCPLACPANGAVVPTRATLPILCTVP